MAKKELTAKEKTAQLNAWQNQLKGLRRLVDSTPDLEDYTEEDWVWVKGNTKPHKEELKFYGLRYCGRKDSPHYQQWYLAAPRWFTEERREAERKAAEEAAARAAEETSVGVLEKLAEELDKLTSEIEDMRFDCDYQIYEALLRLEGLIVEAL